MAVAMGALLRLERKAGLVRLIRHSDGVLETVLELAARDDVLRAKHISDAQRDFWKVLDKLHRLMRPAQS